MMNGCFPRRSCLLRRTKNATGPNSFLPKKKNVTVLNSCCPRMNAMVLNNCHPKRNVTVLRGHCSAGAAIAVVLPAALAFHSGA